MGGWETWGSLGRLSWGIWQPEKEYLVIVTALDLGIHTIGIGTLHTQKLMRDGALLQLGHRGMVPVHNQPQYESRQLSTHQRSSSSTDRG